jgi:hypothetical protein
MTGPPGLVSTAATPRAGWFTINGERELDVNDDVRQMFR